MQLMEVRRVSRHRRGWRILIVLALACLGLAAWLAYEPAKTRYREWKRENALAQARESIAQKDVAKTQLALEVALNAGPADPDTIRIAADMLEQVGAPQAMRLRRAVTRLLPASAADHAALVMSCLRFGDYNAARDAVRAIPAPIAREPAALQAALAYAMSTDDSAVADVMLTELRQREPDNEALAYTHAALRLKLPRAADRAGAVAEINRLVERNPQLRVTAERHLAGAAVLHRDYVAAKQHLQNILATPAATLNDHLQLANIQLLVDHRPFAEVFGRLAPIAAGNPANAATFAQWILVQNRAREALVWLDGLDAQVRQTPEVARVEAEAAARARDRDRLDTLLRAGAWGPLPPETLRLLGAAQAVDTPDKPNLRAEVWDMTLNAGGTSLGTLTALLRVASAWGWDAEVERTEWAIVRHFPDQTWVFQDLFNRHKTRKNTQGMREVLSRLRDSDPSVARYRHDWALLTLLMEPTQNWDNAKATLAQLYENDPTDAVLATGYAVALAQADRGAEALAVVDKLTADQLQYPPRQPYLAYVYGVGRRAADFERARQATTNGEFLPEEKLLVQRGAEALQRPLKKPVPAKASPKA